MPGEDIYSWSSTAANNDTADTLINWREGQARASVNDSSRSVMAAHAKQRDLLTGVVTTSGSANAQIFTSGVGYTSIPTGLRALLKMGFTNTGAMTLSMDGIAAVPVKAQTGGNLVGAEVVVNSLAEFVYNGSNWVLLQSTGDTLVNTPIVTSGTTNHYTIVTGLTALYPGLRILLKISETNTGPAFLNADGLGEVEILSQSGNPLHGGELQAGSLADLYYDGTHWIRLAAEGEGLILLELKAASNSASIDFTTNLDDTFEEYLFTFINVIPGTASSYLRMRYSIDGGATYISSNSYFYGITSSTSFTGLSGVGSEQAGHASMLSAFQVASTQDLSGPIAASGEVRLFNPAGGVQRTNCLWMSQSQNNAEGVIVQNGGGCGGLTIDPVNAIRFFYSTGNIASGNFRLYGVRK